jgi:acetolactate synthase-1/2/3 large subunit
MKKTAKEDSPDRSKREFLKGMTVAGIAALAASKGLKAGVAEASAEAPSAVMPAVTLPPRSQEVTIPVETLGEALVECLTQAGIKYWFVNPGTDWPSFVEALSKRHLNGQDWPKVITVPHEYAATSAAHGYAMVKNESALVGYHVTVGTYNALSAVQNAYYSRIPLVLMAGRRSVTKEGLKGSDQGPIGQEPRDQAAPLREYVKWDYEVRYVDHIPAIVQRALQVANADPKGPVYITIPTETAMMPAASVTIKPKELFVPPAPPMADLECIKLAAKLLVDASFPVIITDTLGANPNAVPKLAKLAEALAIPVIGAVGLNLNLPTTSPMNVSVNLTDADVIFTIASNNPWSGRSTGVIPKPTAKYINLDVDAARVEGYPMSGYYPADLSMAGDPASTLDQLYYQAWNYLRTNYAAQERISLRFQSLKSKHDAQRAAAYASAQAKATAKPIDRAWIQYNIGLLLQANDIVISDYGGVYPYCEHTVPGTYFSSPPSASLGWGLAAALGAKLASPDSTVVAVQGDGSFMYGTPTAVFFAARRHNLPFLAIVYNNQCWRAVWSTAKREYPTGWASKTNFSELTDLSPTPDFGKIAESVGGYGRTVEDPADVPSALQEGFNAVRNENRVACLNFILAHYSG